MKKQILLALVALLAFSCSDDDPETYPYDLSKFISSHDYILSSNSYSESGKTMPLDATQLTGKPFAVFQSCALKDELQNLNPLPDEAYNVAFYAYRFDTNGTYKQIGFQSDSCHFDYFSEPIVTDEGTWSISNNT